ncbi:MAG: hypothetical protein IJY08_03270 [Clostridia bacterium]|nr:hypothetical protein [Clostridia bacterium]
MKKFFSVLLSILMLTASLSMMAMPASAAEAITADSTWYDDTKTTLVISDAADLLAFAAQINAKNTFVGKTVELSADIDLNPGWVASTTAPTNVWDITGCGVNGFWGTFDGKGHTISGIYLSLDSYQRGIFGNFQCNDRQKDADGNIIIITPVVKNLAVVNSVVPVRGNDMGGFYGYLAKGQGDGKGNWDCITFENVYNAIDLITTTAASNNTAGTAENVGGFIGKCNTSGIAFKFTNCVYAGKMVMNTLIHDKVGGFIGSTGTTKKDDVHNTYTNCAYYGNANIGADFFGCFVADGIRADILKNCVSAGIMSSTADAMDFIAGGLVHQKNSSTTITDCLYTTTNGVNTPLGEEVSVAPEGTTFCTHAELIGANAKTPAEGWTKTAGYAMPTELYNQFKTLLDAQTPVVPEGESQPGDEATDTDDNSTTEAGETAENTEKSDNQTEAGKTTEGAGTTEPADDKGCGGVIGLGAVAIVGVAAVAVAFKKKED